MQNRLSDWIRGGSIFAETLTSGALNTGLPEVTGDIAGRRIANDTANPLSFTMNVATGSDDARDWEWISIPVSIAATGSSVRTSIDAIRTAPG